MVLCSLIVVVNIWLFSGVKGAQVEEIYDLSKPFRGSVPGMFCVCCFLLIHFFLKKKKQKKPHIVYTQATCSWPRFMRLLEAAPTR